MPVLVVGADTPYGEAIVATLLEREGELRAFISDVSRIDKLRDRKVKVAFGDVSDPSHIEGAGSNAFCVVLVTSAANDGRETAFAENPDEILRGWAVAVKAAGVQRSIWVTEGEPIPEWEGSSPESVLVDTAGKSPAEVARQVSELEDAGRL